LILIDVVGAIPILEELDALNRVALIHILFDIELYFAYAKGSIIENPFLELFCSTLIELGKTVPFKKFR